MLFKTLLLFPLLAIWHLLVVSVPVQADETVKLKFGTSQPLTHYYCKTGRSFADRLSKYTDGRLQVDIYPSCQLGGERDMLEGLRIGTVQVYAGAMAVLTQFVPEFIAFQLPYLIKDYDHGIRVWNQIMSKKLSTKMDKTGLHLLGFIKSSPRGVQTSKPIMKLSDLNGMRIRTMEAKIYIDAYKALGAIPTPIPYSELISALQAGVVDGADQGFTAFFSSKAYQVCPFFARIDIVQTLSPLILSEITWKKLLKSDKETLEKAAEEALKEQVPRYDDEERKYQNTAKESGFPFGITFPDLKEFQDAVKPMYTSYEKVIGKETINQILALK